MIVDEGKYVAVTAYATYPKDTLLHATLKKEWKLVRYG